MDKHPDPENVSVVYPNRAHIRRITEPSTRDAPAYTFLCAPKIQLS